MAACVSAVFSFRFQIQLAYQPGPSGRFKIDEAGEVGRGSTERLDAERGETLDHIGAQQNFVDVEALAVRRSGIQLIVLLRIWRVRFLDGGEVQQHGRYRRCRLRSEDRRSKPKTFGSSAAAEGNHLALEFVVFAGEKRSLQQLDLLVGEQTHGRPPDRQPVLL